MEGSRRFENGYGNALNALTEAPRYASEELMDANFSAVVAEANSYTAEGAAVKPRSVENRPALPPHAECGTRILTSTQWVGWLARQAGGV